jgi:hypothetical protein
MSWKSTPIRPPQRGMGFEWKISSDWSRKSRIQAGSRFISEIWQTISASSPLRALKTAGESVRKSYLLISPRASVEESSSPVDMRVSPLDQTVAGSAARSRARSAAAASG